MMNRFLKSNFFITLIALIGFLTWAFYSSTIDLNIYGIYFLLSILVLIFIFSKNLVYAIPVLLSLLYSYSVLHPNLNTIDKFGYPHIWLIMFLSGFCIHILRFKPKLKMGKLGLGYLLIGIAYFLNIYYVEITNTYLLLSMMGLLYFLIYVFLSGSVKPDSNYLMRIMFIFSLVLLAELALFMYRGYLSTNVTLTFQERIIKGIEAGWYSSDFGWGNINDVVIQIVLLLPAQFYMMIKHRWHILYYLLPFMTGALIFMSGSRGGYLSYSLTLLIAIPFTIRRAKFISFVYLGLVSYFSVWIIMQNDYLIQTFKDVFINGGFENLDQFSSSRLTLYQNALEIFKQHPLFGGGWESMADIGYPDRIQVYHSTLFHTMAVMGSFGLFALGVYFYQNLKFFFNDRTLEKNIVLIGFITTQLHGLFDNTMYMLVYSIVLIVMIVGTDFFIK